MNKKFIYIVIFLVFGQVASAMEVARKCARVGAGLALIGGGVRLGALSMPYLKKGLTMEREKWRTTRFGEVPELGLQSALSCAGLAAGASMLGTGLFCDNLGSLLLRSPQNQVSINVVAKLSGSFPLSVAGLSMLNSTGCFLARALRNCRYQNYWEVLHSLFGAGLCGVTSATCFYGCVRLFPFKR